MTLYLTDNTRAEEIARAKASGFVHAVKYYPAGATTNSESGRHRARARLRGAGGDGASTASCCRSTARSPTPTSTCSIASACSSSAQLAAIVRDFPGLRIVLEHITTREAAQFVAARRANVAATITPQHLLYSRNALFAGGMRPHLYCLPVLKRETHRRALVAAATSGNPKFFLGTDSAPHARTRRRTPAAAPAAIRRRSRCRSTPKRSRRRARSIGSKASRACTARRSTACRATPTRSRSSANRGRCRTTYPFGERDDRAAARRRDAALAASSDSPIERCAPPIMPREASQTVAAPGAIPGERKVRAPQSGMPGNARPHKPRPTRPRRRRGTGPQRRVASGQSGGG